MFFLSSEPLGRNISEICIKMQQFSYMEKNVKVWSAKFVFFSLGVLIGKEPQEASYIYSNF